MMKNYLLGLSLLGMLALQSCFELDDPDQEQRDRDDQALEDYINTNNINAEQSQWGYYYEPIAQNTNGVPVQQGDYVGIYYKLRLLNGDHIDSLTSEMNYPVPFRQAVNNLVPSAINLGVDEMKSGDEFRFYIPSYRAYWNFQNDTIPAHANIIADITVAYTTDSAGFVDIQLGQISDYVEDQGWEDYQINEDGLFYQQLTAGNGTIPEDGDSVSIRYVGKFLRSGVVFDQTEGSTTIDYIKGATQFLPGWEQAIDNMEEGEKGIAILPSHLAYWRLSLLGRDEIALWLPKSIINQDDYIAPFSILIFEIELVDVKKN